MKKKAAIGFIFITLLIDVIGWGLIIPVMPQLIAGLKHISISEASRPGSLLLFVYAVMQFFCAPILGSLSDQYGRRPVLLFALFGFCIDYIFLGFAPTFGWLFLGRTICASCASSMKRSYNRWPRGFQIIYGSMWVCRCHGLKRSRSENLPTALPIPRT